MKNLGMAYQIKNRSKRGEMRKMAEDSDMPESKSGIMDPKSMASMIMAKKMAKGGMVEDEEMHMPMVEEDESLPLDHATEHDEFLTAESDEMLMGKKKKSDLISRVMMSLK